MTEKEPLPQNVEIIEAKKHLPDTVDGLSGIIIVSEAMLSVAKARLNAVRELPVATQTIDRALRDGWGIAEFLFRAQAKLGEILIATVSAGRPRKIVAGQQQLPEGISRTQSHFV